MISLKVTRIIFIRSFYIAFDFIIKVSSACEHPAVEAAPLQLDPD